MFNSPDFDLDNDGLNLPTFLKITATSSDVNKISNSSIENKQQENRISNNINSVAKTKNTNKFLRIKRKFPGPAGVLPTRNSEEEIEANLILSEIDNAAPNTEILLQKGLICSQAPNKFISNVWDTISNDYSKLMDMYNVKWIQTFWNGDELVNQKVPFLAAMIKSLERVNQSKSSTINVTLEDESGELQGTVHHNLYEKFGVDIKVGNILVLKNCSVLPSNVGDHPHLLITTKNLIRIYRKDSDSILLENINVDEFLKEIIQYKKANKRIKIDSFKTAEPNNVSHINKSKFTNNPSNEYQNLNKITSNENNKFPDKQLLNYNKENDSSKSKFQFKKQDPVANIFQDDNFDLDMNCDFDSDIDEKIAESLSDLENNLKTQVCNKNNEFKVGSSVNSSEILKNTSKSSENIQKPENKIASNSDIWKSAFEGVDVDDFLSDF